MQKHLFFDDNNLFLKENVTRDYGRPQLIAEYVDQDVSTDFCTGWVFRLDDGRYRLMYFGHGKDFKGFKLFSAISDDGVSFSPTLSTGRSLTAYPGLTVLSLLQAYFTTSTKKYTLS